MGAPDARWRSGGFTLIELITVVVILGVLMAAVAPRYFDMAGKAEEESGQQALAEGLVQFNLAYMKYVVDHRSAPSDLGNVSGAGYLDLDGGGSVIVGDYRYTYSQSGDTVTVSAERDNGGTWESVTDADGNVMSRTFEWP